MKIYDTKKADSNVGRASSSPSDQTKAAEVSVATIDTLVAGKTVSVAQKASAPQLPTPPTPGQSRHENRGAMYGGFQIATGAFLIGYGMTLGVNSNVGGVIGYVGFGAIQATKGFQTLSNL